MNVMRLMRSFVILAIIVGFPGYAAARDYGAAEFSSIENGPASPEFEIVVEPDADSFTIKNVGAAVDNVAAEAHAIVSITGNGCKADDSASARPIDYTYEISAVGLFSVDHPRTTSFSTQFGNDFERAKLWFEQLKDAVGPVNDHCLNSIILQHLIKVIYDNETGIRNSRYFLAQITYRDAMDSTTHHRVSNTSEIRTADLDPDRWREKMNQVKLAERIQSWDVSAEDMDRAKKYLIEISGAPSRPAPPRNLRIISN
jgi:hypothetical protein